MLQFNRGETWSDAGRSRCRRCCWQRSFSYLSLLNLKLPFLNLVSTFNRRVIVAICIIELAFLKITLLSTVLVSKLLRSWVMVIS